MKQKPKATQLSALPWLSFYTSRDKDGQFNDKFAKERNLFTHIGCLFGHMFQWQLAADAGDDHAFMLESDAFAKTSIAFPFRDMGGLVKNAPKEYDIIFLDAPKDMTFDKPEKTFTDSNGIRCTCSGSRKRARRAVSRRPWCRRALSQNFQAPRPLRRRRRGLHVKGAVVHRFHGGFFGSLSVSAPGTSLGSSATGRFRRRMRKRRATSSSIRVSIERRTQRTNERTNICKTRHHDYIHLPTYHLHRASVAAIARVTCESRDASRE